MMHTHVGRGAPDLSRAADVIAQRGIRLGAPLSIEDETGSTNDDAKAAARGGAPHGAVFVAESQRAGRGRHGRVWQSPRGENLLFSVVLRLACLPARVPPVSLACGLAVRDAVARALGVGDDERVLVKWPNDVLVRGRDGVLRKVAGILVESSVSGSKIDHVVVGIGVNVHTRAFPEDIAEIATSIALEGKQAPDRAEILADVLACMDRDVEHVVHRGLGLIHARLSARDALRGSHVETDDDAVAGIAEGIDLDGRLLVRGARPLVSGEVRLRARAKP